MLEMVVFHAACKAGRLRLGLELRPRARLLRPKSALGRLCLLLLPLAGCSLTYDWREIRAPGGEYQVHLPAKPATLTREIHIEGLAVEMTMQGARVEDNTFTIATVPLPRGPEGGSDRRAAGETPFARNRPGAEDAQGAENGQGGRNAQDGAVGKDDQDGQRILRAMREQMLRNIGAEPSSPSRPVAVIVVDGGGARLGEATAHAVDAAGSGKSAGMEMRARFLLWEGQAMQIVAVGPRVDPRQAEFFFDSLRLVKR